MKRLVGVLLLAAALGALLFSEYLVSSPAVVGSGLGFLHTIAIEVQAACRDAGTQWMVVGCFVVYLATFLVLERRVRGSAPWGAGSGSVGRDVATSHPSRPASLPVERRGGSELHQVESGAEFEDGKERGHSCPPGPGGVPDADRNVGAPVGEAGVAGSHAPPLASRPVEGRGEPERAHRRLLRLLGDPNVWLIALVLIAVLSYALDYDSASKSTQLLVLLAGITMGKGVAVWVRVESKVQSPRSKVSTVLGILVLLLGVAAVWQPEFFSTFEYRGQTRWSGPWRNPNTFGLFMGVGLVLAIGLLDGSPRSNVKSSKLLGADSEGVRGGMGAGAEAVGSDTSASLPRSGCCARGTARGPVGLGFRSSVFIGVHPPCSRIVAAGPWLNVLAVVVLTAAAAVMAYGLLRSYSRGAWLGTVCGMGFLLWAKVGQMRTVEAGSFGAERGHSCPPGTGEASKADRNVGAPILHLPSSILCRTTAWLRRNWFPVSVLLASLFVIGFWELRHTEWAPARRVFSVGNLNDFSWRNRVAAWEGALAMMADRPWLGFGWNRPEPMYDHYYLAPKVVEGMAIQLNHFFMLGLSAGIPALLLFLMYVGQSFNSPRSQAFRVQCPQQRSEAATDFELKRHWTLDTPQATTCRAAVVVLLIGFWFDGGLFDLGLGVVFWILLELGRFDFTAKSAEGSQGAQTFLSASVDARPGADRNVRARAPASALNQ